MGAARPRGANWTGAPVRARVSFYMSESAPPAVAAPGAEPVEDILHLLRTRVLLVALNVLAVAMPLVCLLFVVQSYRAGALTLLTIALASWALVFPVLRLVRPWLAFRTSALLLLSVMLVSGPMVALRGGLTVG